VVYENRFFAARNAEVRGSIPLCSTNRINNLRRGACWSPFLFPLAMRRPGFRIRSEPALKAFRLLSGNHARPERGPGQFLIIYLKAMPCGRAGPVAKAVLKSSLNRRSSTRFLLVTLATWTR